MIAVAQLPSIEIVDFADPVEEDAYAGLMAQVADDWGAFKSTFGPTAEYRSIERRIQQRDPLFFRQAACVDLDMSRPMAETSV